MKIFTFEKSVGGVIFREGQNGKEFLLLHYPSGHWDFPKGHVEVGETENQTLTREIFEETGITDLEIQKGFRESIFYFYSAKGNERERRIRDGRGIRIFKRVVYFLTKTSGFNEIKISHEHTGFAWLAYSSALERLTFVNGKKILLKAGKKLKLS